MQAELGGWGNRMRLPPQGYYGATSAPPPGAAGQAASAGPPFSVVVDGSRGYDPGPPGAMGPPPPPGATRYAGAGSHRAGGSSGGSGGGGGPSYASPSVSGQPAFDVVPTQSNLVDAYDQRDGQAAIQYVPMVPKPAYYPAGPGAGASAAAVAQHQHQQGGANRGGERRGSGPDWTR